MTLDELPRRWRLAAQQLSRGAFEMPYSAATWTSVVRRTAVMVAFVAYGLITGQLDTAVYAAFGALQIGLGEAALPWQRLLRLLVIEIAAMCATVFLASQLSGSWWTVALLAVLGYAQGSMSSVGLVPRATTIGALALGVIFSGLEGVDPVTATTWLALGAVAQGGLWLLLWRPERDLSVGRALANAVRMVADLLGDDGFSGSSVNQASAAGDQVRDLIRTSGFADVARATAVVDAIDEVRRNTVAWRILREPGVADRLVIMSGLHSEAQALDESILAPRPLPLAEPHEWAVTRRLQASMETLHARVAELKHPRDAVAQPPADTSPNHPWRQWRGLVPGSADFRHGIRMAVAIIVAQAIALLVPFGHSFWIPLTVVFVVKPEWSFTVVRSAARLLGNLAAVILVPTALGLAAGNSVAIAVLIAIVAAVAFRYFSGNYIAASFGVAGTILILDQTLAPDDQLFLWRIVATFIGAVVALVVSALIPSWRGEGPRLLVQVVDGLTQWQQPVLAAVQDPQAGDLEHGRLVGEAERNRLIQLRPAVAAAVLEPHPVADPRALMAATNAAGRAHLSLLALTVATRIRRQESAPGLDVAHSAHATAEALAQAAAALGVTAPPTSQAAAPPEHRRLDDEDAATVAEVARLSQACADLAQAAAWIGPVAGDQGRSAPGG